MMYLVAPTKEFNAFDIKCSLDCCTDKWRLFDDYSDAADYARMVLMAADEHVEEFVIIPLDTGKAVDASLVYTVAFDGCIEGY